MPTTDDQIFEYTEASDEERQEFLVSANSHLAEVNSDQFLDFMHANRHKTYNFPQMLLREARLSKNLAHYEDHIENLRLLVVSQPQRPLIFEALLTYLAKMPNTEEYDAYLLIFKERFPLRSRP
jgi:hypothetical protein